MKQLLEWVKRSWISYFILALLATAAVVVIAPRVAGRTTLFAAKQNINRHGSQYTECLSGKPVSQTFKSPVHRLKGFEIMFTNYQRTNYGKAKIELWDKTANKLIQTWEREMQLIDDGQIIQFYVDRVVNTSKKHVYEVVVTSEGTKESYFIGVACSENNAYKHGALYIGGEQVEQDAYIQVYGYEEESGRQWIFYLFTAFIFMLIAWMVYLRMSGRASEYLDKSYYTEWIFVIIALLMGCFLFNQAGDMNITILHAKDLMAAIPKGKFFDFYTLTMNKALVGDYSGMMTIALAANYNIILYLLLGVIMLPIMLIEKLTGFDVNMRIELWYVNVILAIGVLVSVYLLFLLARKMGQDKKSAMTTAYIYASSMMLVFTTVGFSQLDIIPLILVLLSLLAYVEEEYTKFALIISVPIMLKMFPILIFVPLILLVEKRILHIVKYMIEGISCTLLFKIVFGSNYGYVMTQEKMSSSYNFTGRLFARGFDSYPGLAAMFVVIMIILCIYMYDKEYDFEEQWKYIIIVPVIAFSAFMVFITWHPQWLAIAVPFIALAVGFNRERRSMIFLEWGISVSIVLNSLYICVNNADNYMMNNGIFQMITKHVYSGITIRDVLSSVDNMEAILTSLMVGLLAYFAYVTTHDLLKKQDVVAKKGENMIFRWVTWARIATFYLFCLGMAFMFFFV